MESNNGGNADDLRSDPLDLARHFTGSGVRVPVEIVEANGETVVLDEGRENHGDQGESMEITVEEMPPNGGENLTETLGVVSGGNSIRLNVTPSDQTLGVNHPGPSSISVVSSGSITHDSTQLTPSKATEASSLSSIATDLVQESSNVQVQQTPSSVNSLSNFGMSFDTSSSIDPQLTLQQMSQHFQEVSRSLRNEGIEISPETIASHFPPSLAETLAASIISQTSSSSSSTLLDSSTQGLQIGGISYNDLTDVTRVMNASLDPSLTPTPSSMPVSSGSSDMMGGVFAESDVIPSSPESNFDTNELLNTDLGQDEEVTSKLANAGPVGVAAAAAIMSGRKRKRHVFESNPALRKRHCSKLLRRLKETLDELSTRVGLQACVVTYRPSSKQDKPEPSFKVFGTSPLKNCIDEQKGRILSLMDNHLKKHTPKNQQKQALFDLPPLVFEGIPTPVQEMTQAQLRAFIPHMLKYSTGRGKPGWGKEEMRPVWWPQEVPWQNIRSDARDENQKKSLPWSDCLRKIVFSCYLHHGRADLLPTSSSVQKDNSLELVQSDDPAQQLQLLQQQHGIDLTSLQSVTQEGSTGAISSLGDIASSQVDHSLLSDQQQVFTIDTGLGNCDTTGMPTLADASLAETAARLQQVADETGQVQYATQTVTVTENDAKALGQPVGSTTTVLLTAYPSSHGGAENGETQQPYYSNKSDHTTIGSPTSNVSTTTTPSVQVVYSASHVSELPESIVSNISSHNEEMSITDSNDYLTTPTTSSDILSSNINEGINLESLTSSTTTQAGQ